MSENQTVREKQRQRRRKRSWDGQQWSLHNLCSQCRHAELTGWCNCLQVGRALAASAPLQTVMAPAMWPDSTLITEGEKVFTWCCYYTVQQQYLFRWSFRWAFLACVACVGWAQGKYWWYCTVSAASWMDSWKDAEQRLWLDDWPEKMNRLVLCVRSCTESRKTATEQGQWWWQSEMVT